MTRLHRLAEGGAIDRRRTVSFTFDGRPLQGFAGDTLASALLANGIRIVGRSWKYHRPRGIVAAGVEEPNALMQIGTGARSVPNVLATVQELYEGLVARSVNCAPDAAGDRFGLLDRFSRFMPPGFYYKTFMWPARLWMRYERAIRSMSGLGAAPAAPDPDRYDKVNAHCDVLVAGGGPAGLAAALAAARSGARVILADEQNRLGGSLLSHAASLDGVAATEWLSKTLEALGSCKELRILTRATVFGFHDHNFLTIQERLTDHLPESARSGTRERLWRVRAREVVLATGAHERPLVFSDNDRPGIMLASSAGAYVHRYAVRLGDRVVLFTNNDSAYDVALDLLRHDIAVTAIVDSRETVRNATAAQVREQGVEVLTGHVVVRSRGAAKLTGVEIMRMSGGAVHGTKRRLACDLLATSGGWSPVIHLSAQSGAKAHWNENLACFLPGAPVQRECSVGSCNGVFDLSAAIADGTSGGASAARRAGWGDAPIIAPHAVRDHAWGIEPLWLVPGPTPSGRGPKQFVDLQNDVSAADIALAAREGYRSVEHAKRYTAMGFGTDQGKLGNVNGMAILAQVIGKSIANTGTTTFRPNYTPVTFGAIAGRELGGLFDPIRKTAIHAWHVQHGALFENVGQWHRPWYYPEGSESLDEAVRRECLQVRRSVGIMDASTLGKIDIRGSDAARFLNLVYTNAWLKLEVGRCRYGLMLDENGMVFDDGVTTRLADNHYLMTTTTGGAARVLAWLERWHQTEWPELELYLSSVTDHWATIAIVGPDSRRLLSRVCHDVDLGSGAFPFMSYRTGTVAGVAARIMRISFSGELAFEINVGADYGRAVWEAVWAAGQDLGVAAYGTESMHVLRAEKGFIIVGQDTDGSVTPIDLGMDWIVAKNKDFIGRRSLARHDTARADRKQLVGLTTVDPAAVLPEGGQIIEAPDSRVKPSGHDENARRPVPMIGHVTSSYLSPSLGRSIALALVTDGRRRKGDSVRVVHVDGRSIEATITEPVFYDVEGARQNA